jgi:Dolichyl-phosphate-mannose-protein mannosyltransferase
MRRDVVACVVVFAITLFTHLTYEFLSQGDFFYPDSYTYITPALSVLHGLGFTSEDGPETLRTPGYPVFLLPFLAMRTSPATIVAVNHLLDALLAALLYLLARRNGARQWIAIAAALILAFDTITIHYANKILTETLSATLVVVIFLIVMNRKSIGWLVTAGLLCGTLVLVRPVAIAYFGVIMLWLAWTGVRPMIIAAFVASAVALPFAWASRNAEKTGVFTISPVGAINLMSYRAAAALAIEDGGDFHTQLQKRQKELDAEVTRRVIAAEGVESQDDLSSADLSRYYSAVARPILLHHPRGTALMTLRGFGVNMIDTDWDALAEVVDDELISEDVTRIAVIAWTWLVWIVTLAGLVMLFRRDRVQAALIAGTIFYFLFMAAGGEAEGRFRVPVIPMMALAAAGVGRAASREIPGPSPRMRGEGGEAG